jgi:MinD superfamily P-loop ATPase
VTLRVATVLSAREWEANLVAEARRTAAVRLVLRAYQPGDVDERLDELDVVVAGAETSWVTPARIATWRRRGVRVVGIHPEGDRPGRDLLRAAGADEVLDDTVPVDAILQTIRFLAPPTAPGAEDVGGAVVAVTGPRGAPGRTEVALALASRWARKRRTILIDLDLDAPALAIRLGLSPRPDLTDAADRVRETGAIPAGTARAVGRLHVVVGSHRPGEPSLRRALVEDVVEAAAAAYPVVVLDAGETDPDDPILKRADHAVLVVDAGALGIVRAARAVAEWSGPPPALVLNRVGRGRTDEATVAARRWTGLDPAAFVPDHRAIAEATRHAGPPDRRLDRALSRLQVPA